MEQMNLHKQKLYALITAGVGLIAVFLPWWKVSYGGFGVFGGLGSYSVNGMHDLGIITFLGFIGAGVATFIMGDKSKPFEGQAKMIVAGCFAGAGLFALIQFLRQTSFTSFGLYLSILAGIAGAVLVYVLKPEQLEGKKPPTPPPPPPPGT
jgi:peptidoglycan/LPS O-acetylase OafA/YrhL